MNKRAAPEESNRAKRRKYRDEYEIEKGQFFRSRAKFRAKYQDLTNIVITDAFIVPSNVDMESFCGTEHELTYAMEELYANYGQ